MSNTISIVQYNLLAPKLATPKHFPHCDPINLKKETRWNQIFIKLQNEIERNSIICLQEVSQEWCGKLTTFFENVGYAFITRLYGQRYNGYMGIGIAFPRTKYELEDCHLVQVNDFIQGIQLEKVDDTWINWLSTKAFNWWTGVAPQEDHWARARYKWNTMIVLKLSVLESQKKFVVANYHMPCDFTRPTVMMIHSSIAMQQAQKLAGEIPLVFAGDWNFQPESDCYELITTGKMPSDFKMQVSPTSVPSSKWTPDKNLKPMTSAYAKASIDSSEPPYTNYAFTEWSKENFIATLDYIFLSNHGWTSTVEVDSLPTGDPTNVFLTPLPTAEEPSDHLKLRAQITLT